MTNKKAEVSVDEMVAENAMLNQRLAWQNIIAANVNSELLQQREINNSLRRIIYFMIQRNGGEIRIHRDIIISTDLNGIEINMEVDPLTNDWIFRVDKDKENK